MRRLLSIGVSGMVICILAYGAWAGESRGQTDAVELLPPPQARTLVPLARPVHIRLENDVMAAKAVYVDDTKRLLIEGERHGFFHIFVSSSLLGDNLTSVAELAYNALELGMQEDFNEHQHQLLRFRLEGKQGNFEYGTEYFYIGKNFEKPTWEKALHLSLKSENDREGGQVWGKWRLGMASVRLDFTESWDNVDKNPHRPQIRTRQGRVGLDVASPAGLFFSLFYSRGTSYRPQEPPSLFNTVDTVLYYSRTTWDATLSSTYSWPRDTSQPANAIFLVYHELRVSYRPTSAIYLEPTLSFTQEKDLPSQAQYTAFATSLSFAYSGLFEIFDLTAYGAYASSHSTDGYTNTRTLDATVNLTWSLRNFPRGTTTLSLEIAYRRFLDLVYVDRSYEEISGMLFLKVAYIGKTLSDKQHTVDSPL